MSPSLSSQCEFNAVPRLLIEGEKSRRRKRPASSWSFVWSASCFLFAIALLVGTVHSHGSSHHDRDGSYHRNDGDVPMCGTVDFNPAQMRRIADISKKKKKKARMAPSSSVSNNITIDTYFCIVTESRGYGDFPNSGVVQQLSVLNANFANSSSAFRFQLKGIKRFQQPNAFTTPLNDYINQLGISCHQGGIDALNIFIIPNIESTATSTTLGITFPFFIYGVNYVDGVYINRNTLPGMFLPKLDHGITCVHEVGHWLGLMHPFQALGDYASDPCNPDNPQDYVADTPLMARPSYGCPLEQDSCPNATGLDPTNNFMGYSDDYDWTGRKCRTMFTRGQVARMEDVWYYYRVQNEICAADELQFSLQFQFDQHPEEISWEIKLRNGTVVHSSVSDELGDTYSSYFAGETINIDRCLPRKRYILTIFDSGGDGIALPGFFQFSLDGNEVARGGQDFTSAIKILFGSTPHLPNATDSDDDTTNRTIVVHNDAPPGSCFSARNTVEVANKGVVSMKDLQIGDMVKDADGNMVRVYSFGHYHTTRKTEYLQIHGDELARPLEISKDHLLFVNGVAIPASLVSVGDTLDVGAGQRDAKVTKIKSVSRSGAYAPFTTSGTIVVSGVAASSYVSLQTDSGVFMLGAFKTPLSMHWLAHFFQSPHRLSCIWVKNNCKSESYTEDGISIWVKHPMVMSKWLMRQNPAVAAPVLMLALLVVLLPWLLELCCLHVWILLLFVAALAIAPLRRPYFTCTRFKTKVS